MERDTFVIDNLPPKDLWSEMDYSPSWLRYPERLNAGVELLDHGVERFGAGKIFCQFSGGRWTYGQLLSEANKIAQVLITDCKLIPGGRVLLRGPNSPMLAACWFGVQKAGGICVTTMPMLRAKEISYILDKAKVQVALCEEACLADLEQASKEAQHAPRIIKYHGFPGRSNGAELESLARDKSNSSVQVPTAATDVSLIAFTSGTTGKAKATVHFHRDVLAICDSFPRSTLKPTDQDIFIGTPPLAFTFGLGGILLFPMRYGASTTFIEKAAPEDFLNACNEFKATISFTSPTGYRGMIPLLQSKGELSLIKGVSAGETLPVGTFQNWKEATGMSLIDGIGATELLHIFISAAGDEIRPGTTGKAIPGYQAKIINAEGATLPNGQVGLLAVRGPTGCRYLSDNERQKEYVRGGWNVTGDAYLRDDDGYFHFQARADDMIISSGYNISGPEVENTLLLHPKVKECAVVAAPDTERGNIVKAFIVLKNEFNGDTATIKELQDFVKAEIAPYKYPRAIEFRTSLPRTETGKLQRFKLREPHAT